MDVDQESTWFALSVLDSLITSTVAYIDSKVGPGRGIQVQILRYSFIDMNLTCLIDLEGDTARFASIWWHPNSGNMVADSEQ